VLGPGAGATGATAEPGQAGAALLLSVAAVARRLGIAPATLRTWDRRYGLGPAGHVPGAHRRYDPGDVARLEAMQHALLRGAAPADAARYALGTRPRSEVPVAIAPETLPAPLISAERPEPPMRPVRIGGQSLRLPRVGPRARGLARAAIALDAAAVRELLDDSLAAQGVIATWDLVLRPVLGAIANCWESTGAGVEIEHLLTEGALGAFRDTQRTASPSGRLRPVLLACVPDELHSLPLYPLAAALAHRGVRCQVLGAALPAVALTAAVRRTAPSAVFLWAQATRYAVPELLGGLPRIRSRVRVFAGGPGWTRVSLPAGAELLDTLGSATDRITAAVGNGPQRRLVSMAIGPSLTDR
jgi:MerR family transcriptional regulator, light-induced transcriptional regulator